MRRCLHRKSDGVLAPPKPETPLNLPKGETLEGERSERYCIKIQVKSIKIRIPVFLPPLVEGVGGRLLIL